MGYSVQLAECPAPSEWRRLLDALNRPGEEIGMGVYGLDISGRGGHLRRWRDRRGAAAGKGAR